jgi:hypothetical protein
LCGPAGAAGTEVRTLVTASAANGVPLDDPAQRFACSDRIFFVLSAKGLPEGRHRLNVRWLNPRGRQQEHTEYAFFAVGASTRVWAWLDLHKDEDGVIDRVLFQDRSSGMAEFLGEWQVRAYIDGDEVARERFRVDC